MDIVLEEAEIKAIYYNKGCIKTCRIKQRKL